MRGQSVELTIRPAKIERDVAVGDVAALGEAFLERGDCARTLIAGVQEADDRQLGWLCASRERPSHRTADQRDELAALQLTELHSAALSQSGSIADWRPLL